jgi:hypothetical protein
MAHTRPAQRPCTQQAAPELPDSVDRSLLYTNCTYSHYYCDFPVVHEKKRPTRGYVKSTLPAALPPACSQVLPYHNRAAPH